MPFAHDFFDAIVSLDSYHYYGTDFGYLEFHILRHLKRGGADWNRVACISSRNSVAVPRASRRRLALDELRGLVGTTLEPLSRDGCRTLQSTA